ncbi:membrane indolylacetylinositol arabinosyltransferase embC domain protein [Mycobacterium xenopi 4042]|uniref:Membrane indolylacetylinositol arabinosyltransferase embC domain protein n=1 Tax=Mycobacterium xenopi 4042 TaxID=1299334 RepID=X7ZKA8_MYCXE|nr:membrane indolylacetylinositol arabinosyltransferase embC domain protein [Mycobacterium xenopi 4042]
MQCDQRGDGQRHAEDHRGHLQRRGGAAVAGVDGRRERQPGRRGPGQVGEDADDLRPEVVAAAFAAQRCARRSACGPWRNPTNSPVTLSACAVKVSRWQAG